MTTSPDTQHYIHLQLLKLLAENPCMLQRDLSRKMGGALGRVNYCLSRDVALADPTLLEDLNLNPPFKV